MLAGYFLVMHSGPTPEGVDPKVFAVTIARGFNISIDDQWKTRTLWEQRVFTERELLIGAIGIWPEFREEYANFAVRTLEYEGVDGTTGIALVAEPKQL